MTYRDVEELLVERGLDISYETVRSWVLKFVETRGTAEQHGAAIVIAPDGNTRN